MVIRRFGQHLFLRSVLALSCDKLLLVKSLFHNPVRPSTGWNKGFHLGGDNAIFMPAKGFLSRFRQLACLL